MTRSRLFAAGARLLRTLAIALLGAVAAALVSGVVYLNQKDDLSVWHTAHLDAEFDSRSAVATLSEYRGLEERLFVELRRKVRDRLLAEERTDFNRFNTGSRSDPETWERDWNRTFELAAEDSPFGALLLHGYSDSPYSLRTIGEALHARGAHVLGLRIPGHGTAPSGLVHTELEDMVAAVRLAAAHLAEQLGGRPLFVVGYSNGAALALEHALASVSDPDLPRPAGLVLLSPEIGVTPAAAAADLQARIGELLGLDKLAWNTVLPEYDPYKYGSFAVNAGVQARRITLANQAKLDALARDGLLSHVPPILAFQSAVDATVRAPAVLHGLFDRLPPGGHRLVAFDINRRFASQGLIDAEIDAEALLSGPPRGYDAAVVTNRAEDVSDVVVKLRLAGMTGATVSPTRLAWPDGVFSLSHLALPFAVDDPLYGGAPPSAYDGVRLGTAALRGETGVLKLPLAPLARMRWNPFHALMMQELVEFIDGVTEDAS